MSRADSPEFCFGIIPYRLLTQAESLDECAVAVDVLVVLLQVLGQVLNTIGEQCYLALNRASVFGVLAILAENLNLLCLI